MRVDRCFAFVDLCGFTAFTDLHGDERVVLVLAELRAALREAGARRGVRVVKWLGDGAMLSSTMIDAVVALVVELDHRMATATPSLALRAGMDFGPVIMFEGDDYIGRSVNVASRLCDRAQPHELLATRAVLDASPPWTEADDCQPHIVRSFENPIEVAALRLAHPHHGAVTDPICDLSIPREHAVRLPDSSEMFCSDACAGAWVERRRQRRSNKTLNAAEGP